MPVTFQPNDILFVDFYRLSSRFMCVSVCVCVRHGAWSIIRQPTKRVAMYLCIARPLCGLGTSRGRAPKPRNRS